MSILLPIIALSANLEMYLSQFDTSSNKWETPKTINSIIYPSSAVSIAYNGSHFGIAYVQALRRMYVQYGPTGNQ